ncbi:MAG: thioredoxin family protein [Chrysiogenetes bacterium]|nr:thioredoxin family protein [Chrysiogenetes bacterium]
MRQIRLPVLALVFALAGAPPAMALKPGEPAPAFTLQSSTGQEISLADYLGKYVVLEWLNHGCPYVKKHYKSGNMQKLQKRYTEKGVVWLSVISSAPGKQGHGSPEETEAQRKARGSNASAVLIDESGAVGKKYGAKATPHMYVITPEGTLAYVGAIDDRPTTDLADVDGAKNYVADALDALLAGKPVATSATKAYGCSVKYAD